MKKIITAVIIAIIVGVALYVVRMHRYVETVETELAPVAEETALSTEAPVFTWKFEMSESKNPDGLPNSEISLSALYGEKTLSKPVAVVPGSCNELPDKEKDSAAGSSVLQCYAAGAGDRFKVVKGGNAYLVMRQEFEEGSPEYNPPIQTYKTVAEFPFAI